MTDPKIAAEALQWIIAILGAHSIPYQVTGGLAGIAYGSQRPLRDIDLDIPENRITELVPDVQKYITFGPKHMNDGSWDLLLLTLEYKGQIIDLGGAFDARIYDKTTKKWTLVPCDLRTAETHTLYGLDVPVINPKDYIWYKRILHRTFDGIDIDAMDAAAAERYLETTSYTHPDIILP